jgi:hypothetical protein
MNDIYNGQQVTLEGARQVGAREKQQGSLPSPKHPDETDTTYGERINSYHNS